MVVCGNRFVREWNPAQNSIKASIKYVLRIRAPLPPVSSVISVPA